MKVRKYLPKLKLADYYMGRDREYHHELTPELRANARETLRRVNRLLKRAGLARKISSGWRPAAVNATVPGAAKGSKHISCLAIDLEDRDGALDAWCNNPPGCARSGRSVAGTSRGHTRLVPSADPAAALGQPRL